MTNQTHILESHDRTYCGLSSLMVKKEIMREVRYKTAEPNKATCCNCQRAFYIAKNKERVKREKESKEAKKDILLSRRG